MTIADGTLQAWRQVGFNARGKTITYRRFLSQTTNTKTGAVTPSFSNSGIDKVLVTAVGSGETAQMKFRIRTVDLPEEPPDKRSRIIYKGEEWIILDYKTDQSRLIYDIICKRP